MDGGEAGEQSGGIVAQSATSAIDFLVFVYDIFFFPLEPHIYSQQAQLPPNGELPCSVRGKCASQEQEIKA